MGKFIDLTNKKFNRLLVLSRGENNKYNCATWNCKCDCGNEVNVRSADLKSGHTNSCGCYRKERLLEVNTTHQLRDTPEYVSWYSMKTRCYNEKAKSYDLYGGKGIKVCDRWLNSFENFLHDMGKRPSKKHSIDRIDPDSDYEPNNCRWATAKEQAYNFGLSRGNTTGVKGVHYHKVNKKFTASIGINGKNKYLGSFTTKEEAGQAYNDYIDANNLLHRKAVF